MKNLSSKWQKAIVWFTGYVNVIAFFLAGGYVYLNTQDKDVKGTAKTALGVVIGFNVLDILRSVVYNIASLADVEYKTLNVISDIGVALTIVKAVVFATLFIVDVFIKKSAPVETTEENE